MLKAFLRRLRQFMAADVTAALDRIQADLHAARAENTMLHGELASLHGQLAALRDELTEHGVRDTLLARQMEAALLTIALNRREAHA